MCIRDSISPSQLEKYYTCRYGYFLQYVLGLKPRQILGADCLFLGFAVGVGAACLLYTSRCV